MNEDSIMPYGKYKGQKLIAIPLGYLLWMYDNGNLSGELKKYAEEQIGVLRCRKEQQSEKTTDIETEILSFVFEQVGGIENIDCVEENCGSFWIDTKEGTIYTIQLIVCNNDNL